MNITKCKFVCIFNRLFTFNFGAFKQMIFIDFDQPNFSNILRIVSKKALDALDQNLVPLLSSALSLRDVGLCRGILALFCHGTWAWNASGSAAPCTVAAFQDALLSFAARRYEAANLLFAKSYQERSEESRLRIFVFAKSKNMQKLTTKKTGGWGLGRSFLVTQPFCAKNGMPNLAIRRVQQVLGFHAFHGILSGAYLVGLCHRSTR